jgi:signal transduction histidine kinase
MDAKAPLTAWSFPTLLRSEFLPALTIALLYSVLAKISFLVTIPPGNISPIFPSAGLALAAVLIWGRPALVGVWLGSFMANINSFYNDTLPTHFIWQAVMTSCAIGLGAMLGAYLGATLVRRFSHHQDPLNSGRNVLVLVCIGALLCCLISPTVGVTSLSVAGYIPWENFTFSWLTWWLGDASGSILLAPFILAWHKKYHVQWQWKKYLEALTLSVMTLGLCYFVFAQNMLLEYLLLPMMLWAAFRFGIRGCTLIAVVIAIFTSISTSNGNGPFIGKTVVESLLLLHSFLAVSTLCALLLAAVLAHLRQVQQQLSKHRDELESAFVRLQISQQQLASSEAKAMISTLVASVTHEVGTPMGNSLLASTTMREHTMEFQRLFESESMTRTKLSAYLSDMSMGTEMLRINLSRAKTLIDSFGHLAADQASEQRRRFDLAVLMKEILLSLHPTLKHKQQQVVVTIPDGIIMDSVPSALAQIAINLINNAFIHGFDGRTEGVLSISARVQNEQLHLVFFDNGVGMSAEHLSKLFTPFFSTKIGQGGTGLGMSIIHNLVKKTLHGEITVHSELGQGTQFDLRLPIKLS